MFNNTVNQFTRKLIAIVISAAVMVVLLGTTTQPAHAASILVTSLADLGAGTLRAALSAAGSGDTITFSVSGTIKLASQLTINNAVTIDGTGQTITLDAQKLDRVFCVPGATALTLNLLTISYGYSANSKCAGDFRDGGAIYNNGTLTMTNSTISGNEAFFFGGGIYNSGTLTVTSSTLYSNHASYGGGIYNVATLTVTNSTISSNSVLEKGGGIFSTSAVTVTNSTFSNNSGGSEGGGLYGSGVVTVTNSTFSGNSANNAGSGIFSTSAVTVTNSTFSGNWGNDRGGGINTSGLITLSNTIITNSGSNLCFGSKSIKNTNSLIDDSSCGIGANPVTGLSTTLANNGGSTQTLALTAGSNAIDGVPAGQCTVATDQRGYGRPAGLLCDIGAYEYGAVAPAPAIVSSVSSSGAVTNGPTLNSCYQPNGSLVSSVKINVPTVTANGAAASIFCQILTDPAQYNVTGQTVTLAIDVFALTTGGQSVTAFSTPVQVCLQGSGSLLFRDATGLPRVTTPLSAISIGNYTCGSIPNAGTLILIAGAAASAGSVGGGAAVASHPLTGCLVSVIPKEGVLMHSAPDVNSSAVGNGIPVDVKLTVTDRAGDWVKVTYGAVTGWVLSTNLSLSINTCN